VPQLLGNEPAKCTADSQVHFAAHAEKATILVRVNEQVLTTACNEAPTSRKLRTPRFDLVSESGRADASGGATW
jgi:hypothetical protein